MNRAWRPSSRFRRKRPTLLAILLRHLLLLGIAVAVAAAAYVVASDERADSLRDAVEAIVPHWLSPHDTRMIDGVSVRVVDGDSLRTANGEIRLLGIDAPELHQTCRDENGREWACGRAARDRLRALVGRRTLACASRERDRYGRALAVCAAGDIADLGETLVLDGYAVHYGGSTRRYAAAEAEARAARRGLWRGNFERPELWRARRSTERGEFSGRGFAP
jgi:endonuclease YncB( thermonuclease family)